MSKQIERGFWKKAVALVLALAFVASPFRTETVEAAAPAFGTHTIYKWTKVTDPFNSSQLPHSGQFRVILTWREESDPAYASIGIDADDNVDNTHKRIVTSGKLTAQAFDSNVFYTADAQNSLFFEYVELDGDNHDAPKYFIYLPDGNNNRSSISAGFTTSGPNMWLESGNDYRVGWTVTNRLDNTMKDHVKIFYSRPDWYDCGWLDGADDNPANYLGVTEKGEKNYGQFSMYVGKEERCDAITADYTVRSGEILTLQDRTFINPGVTLTVEDGGVLDVKGALYNNGVITSEGTILVQKNASILPSYELNQKPDQTPAAKNGIPNTSLICSKGGLLIQKGAILNFSPYSGTFAVRNGAACVNAGTIIATRGIDLTNGSLENRDTGVIFAGYFYFGMPLGLSSSVRSAGADIAPKISGNEASMKYVLALPGVNLGSSRIELGQTGSLTGSGVVEKDDE